MGGLIFNLQGLADILRGIGENDFIIMGNDNLLTWKILDMAPDKEFREKESPGENKVSYKGFPNTQVITFVHELLFYPVVELVHVKFGLGIDNLIVGVYQGRFDKIWDWGNEGI